jgi:hypothetical protein
MHKSPILFSICLITVSLCSNQPLLAETLPIPIASDAPLELDLLINPKGSLITADTINQEKLTVPSLWWLKENFDNQLLANWIVYPTVGNQPARVDLIVNQRIWSLLDYIERYSFVNRLGTFVRNYGYNVRVFNYQKEPLASYTCNFQVNPALCRIEINSQNKFGFERFF